MTQAFSIYTSDTSPAGDLAYIHDPLLVIDDERYIRTADGNVLPNTALLGYNGKPIAGKGRAYQGDARIQSFFW